MTVATGPVGRGVTHTADSPGARLTALPSSAVELTGGLWHDRVTANRIRGIPLLHDRLEEHGVIDNFRRRTGKPVERRGFWFTDSDLYKWMEGAAWSLAAGPDADVADRLAEAVAVVVRAQDPDGYLNTNFEPDGRFPDLSWSHELYCAGHLIQAALAHRRVTGEDELFATATRLADFLVAEFGEGGRDGRDRHPGVETALVELARETGRERYLDLARRMLDRVDPLARAQLTGHAVCATYFACGLADVAAEAGGGAYLGWAERLWDEMMSRHAYVTGGLGGRWLGESVGRPYELPNEGAYAETCAAVGAAQWAWRMLTLSADGLVADQLELILHNAVLAGISLPGDEWFYANPLASFTGPESSPFIGETLAFDIAGPLPLRRRPWRDVTCCPPNAVRLLGSLPGYLYGADPTGLWVHLYASSRVRHAGFDLTVETDLPWRGNVALSIAAAPAGESSLNLRLPGWAESISLTLNGSPTAASRPGAYQELRRIWQPGDRVTLELGAQARLVECNPRVAENAHRVALRKGALVYCAEAIDNPDYDLRDIALPAAPAFEEQWRPDLLGGVVVLTTSGSVPTEPWGPLYRTAGDEPDRSDVPLRLVPYYSWANRGPAAMTVWLDQKR